MEVIEMVANKGNRVDGRDGTRAMRHRKHAQATRGSFIPLPNAVRKEGIGKTEKRRGETGAIRDWSTAQRKEGPARSDAIRWKLSPLPLNRLRGRRVDMRFRFDERGK